MLKFNDIPSNAMKLELRLDWSEQDTFLHINNVAYFKYTQAARLKMLEKVGLVTMHQTENIGPTLGHTQCKFIKPLFYPGQIVVYSYVKEIKNTSFVIQHVIINSKNEIVAEAEDVIVVYDYSNEIKQEIPVKVKEVLLFLTK
jgi:acyl-CoA thioester hydrolase